MAFRQAIEVNLQGKTLAEGSEQYQELKSALQLWGNAEVSV
jgi:2,3-diketo-5-methylthiopentyl-1-phosphate enolase